MAKSFGIIGSSRGKIGNVTFKKSKGIQIVTSTPLIPNYQRSEPQLAQQFAFRLMIKFLHCTGFKGNKNFFLRYMNFFASLYAFRNEIDYLLILSSPTLELALKNVFYHNYSANSSVINLQNSFFKPNFCCSSNSETYIDTYWRIGESNLLDGQELGITYVPICTPVTPMFHGFYEDTYNNTLCCEFDGELSFNNNGAYYISDDTYIITLNRNHDDWKVYVNSVLVSSELREPGIFDYPLNFNLFRIHFITGNNYTISQAGSLRMFLIHKSLNNNDTIKLHNNINVFYNGLY